MSLRDQLAQVAAANATVAFDRKRRQKLHSASLIYNPKTAAAQDFESIYEAAVSALEELTAIEPRFKVFAKSLFSEASMSIDRNVQTVEENKKLDTAISGYLMLASAKWHLTPTLHATEWLVRRFQIHISNAEVFLLSTLNYYQTPVFKRILDITKLPPLFRPLSAYMRSDKQPSKGALMKMFNDLDFLQLYCQFLSKCIKHTTTYTNQLLFTTCCFINLIALNSNNEEKLNQLVPILLEISAKLLGSDSADCQIAAHTTLCVFATAFPLQKEIVLAAIETILANLVANKAENSALVSICKIFQTLKGEGNVDQLPSGLYKLFDSKFNMIYLQKYFSTAKNSDKFLTSYVRSIIRYDHIKLNSIVSLLRMSNLEKYQTRLIVTDLIYLSEVLLDKSQLVEVFEYLISIHEEMVLKALKSLNLTPEEFEIRLTTSLFKQQNINLANGASDTEVSLTLDKNTGQKKAPEIPFREFMDKNADHIDTSGLSMFIAEDSKFVKLLSLFADAISKGYQSGLFLSSFFTTLESRITFLLRTIVSPSAPRALRSVALVNISKCINSIDKDSNVFTIVPILICALSGASKLIKTNIKKIFTQISSRPFTKHYFMVSKLYGDVTIPMLGPKDAEAWLANFMGEYMIDSSDFSSLLVPHQKESVYLLFWANQALLIPLPYPKTVLLRSLDKHDASSFSSLFKEFLTTYLEFRDVWELKCTQNKTSFKEFEEVICTLIVPKEKSQFVISFIINSLKSVHEQLAEAVCAKVATIFDTLKATTQFQILEAAVDSSVESEDGYDTVAFVQSLPLKSEAFTSYISKLQINQSDEVLSFLKKRKKQPSTAKPELEGAIGVAEILLRKITVLLETLDKVAPVGTEALLAALFNVLSDLETLDRDGRLPVLYAQETLASCMLNTIRSLKDNGFSKLSNIRPDVLVSSIRSSSSPQVQNKLLLVISALATLNSETILHSIMPIFTFMGAHSIRQDDEFTTQVVENTIQSVVPALLQGCTGNIMHEIEFLLMSFSTALQHVPKHRRVQLYSTLVKALGADRSIAPFLFLIAQQYSTTVDAFKITEQKNFLEFTKTFLANFAVNDQIHGLKDVLNIIKALLDSFNLEDRKAKLESRPLFTTGVANFSDSELMSLIVNSIDFVNRVVQDSDMDYYDVKSNMKLRIYTALSDKLHTAASQDIKNDFPTLLEVILLIFSELIGTNVDAYNNQSRVRLKESLLNLLGNILSLLPIDEFVDSTLPMLSENKNNDLIYHLVLVIDEKLELESQAAVKSATKVISTFLQLVEHESTSSDIVQVSLNAIGTLFGKYATLLDEALFTKSLTLATGKLSTADPEVLVSLVSVITNCIQATGVKSIAFYSKIVPPVLEIFEHLSDKKYSNLRPQIELSVVLLFGTLIKRLPGFLISNMQDMFKVIFFSSEVEASTRLSVIALVVEHMELKEVLRTLKRSWDTSISKSDNSISISLFLSALESTVGALDKKSATSQSPTFFKLLLSMFEYRSTSGFDTNTISRIEATVHDIANQYVLKLNDKVFRPLFAAMVRWAFDGEGVVNASISEQDRLIAFLRFFNKLQENLKGIVTSYFTYLLEPVNALLQKFVTSETKNVNLRRLCLNSLVSSFKYDKDEYWKSTSRFEMISASLVGQLSNIEPVIGKYLVKAIALLAANNSGAEEHNKILHKLLVDHMKASCSSNEKLWAIKSLKLIYSKVGESWLVLLPQLVPTIAELLEDEDEAVESEVRMGLVRMVENVLGEPFDRYLD